MAGERGAEERTSGRREETVRCGPGALTATARFTNRSDAHAPLSGSPPECAQTQCSRITGSPASHSRHLLY